MQDGNICTKAELKLTELHKCNGDCKKIKYNKQNVLQQIAIEVSYIT